MYGMYNIKCMHDSLKMNFKECGSNCELMSVSTPGFSLEGLRRTIKSVKKDGSLDPGPRLHPGTSRTKIEIFTQSTVTFAGSVVSYEFQNLQSLSVITRMTL